MKRVLERERFDLIHVHEPMTPAIAVHRACAGPLHDRRHLPCLGQSRLDARSACRSGGYLLDRLDARIAVSEQARASIARWTPAHYEIVPNGILIPERVDAEERENEDHLHRPARSAQGSADAAARLARDPPPHRGDPARDRRRSALGAPAAWPAIACAKRGSSLPGFLSEEELTRRAGEREAAGCALARRRELRHGADARLRLRDAGRCLGHPRLSGRLRRARGRRPCLPATPRRSKQAVIGLLEDEPRRRQMGEAAREIARERYDWHDIARRLLSIYELAIEGRFDTRRGGEIVRASGTKKRVVRGRRRARALGRRRGLALAARPQLVAARVNVRFGDLGLGRRGARAELPLDRRSLAGLEDRDRPGRSIRRARAIGRSSRPSRSGLFANAVLPGRIGEVARVAVLTRRSESGRESGRHCWERFSPTASSISSRCWR